MTVISADKLAKDVAGAEALLKRHEERRHKIGTEQKEEEEDNFTIIIGNGRQLNVHQYFSCFHCEKFVTFCMNNVWICNCSTVTLNRRTHG